MRRSQVIRLGRPALFAAATLTVLFSCTENLPTGPDAFAARLEIGVTSDTIIVGDSSKAQARAIGPNNVLISDLNFNWTTSSSATLALGSADAAPGRTRTLVAVKPGLSVVTLSLPDKRFTTTNVTRTQTVVVGGVKVLSTHDSTLTAVNDTGFAIATSLVKNNGALVNRASQGIRWIHQGTRTTVVGTGDTIRYIARSNGADTLIATHDFCLKSAKCADTVTARVAQVLTMSLSAHAFQVWTFSDSVGPAVTLRDRRGNGLPGATVRFVPVTLADSTIVAVTPPLGVSNPATGSVAAPRLVSIGNGTARVAVNAIAPDGSIIATDTVTETVRQVARRILVEPQRAVLSDLESIPYQAIARDARGAVIADATVDVSASGTNLSVGNIGPNSATTPTSVATITPTLTGVAVPDSNPQAPQVGVTVLQSSINLIAPDTVKIGATSTQISTTLLDSNGSPAIGVAVRFSVTGGGIPAPVTSDANGNVLITWVPPNFSGTYTLTGTRDVTGTSPLDSIGVVVIKRRVVVVPDAANSSATISPLSVAGGAQATITVLVKDVFNNPVTTAVPGDIAVTPSVGTVNAGSCTNGVCSFTYTAPAGPATATITVKIGGVNVVGSPISLPITP